MHFDWKHLTLLFFLSGIDVQAQIETEPLEQEIEAMAENMPEDFDYAELSEKLAFYIKHHIDINNTHGKELTELGILSANQVHALLNYRKESGNFIDLLELQAIDGFGLDLVQKLLPYIKIGQEKLLENINLFKGSHDLIVRYGQVLQKQDGYRLNKITGMQDYEGSAAKFMLRYRYRSGDRMSASLNLEKDPGEVFLKLRNQGFDFSSGNICLNGKSFFNKWIIGDYSLQFGQGLTYWSGTAFGKGAAIVSLPKQGLGLKPYTSSGEVMFMRGTAMMFQYKKLSLTPFLSSRKLDASLDDDGKDSEITSLGQSGLHRTVTEVKGRKLVVQRIAGLAISYHGRNFAAGVLSYQARFGRSIAPGKSLYQKFELSGNGLNTSGVYLQYNRKNFYFFGESAYCQNGGNAFVLGAIGSLSPKVSIVMLRRDYGRDYQSLFNQAISESSSATNEKGTYTGLTITPLPKLELNLYSDIFSFPWLKYRVDAPSRGHELFTQLNWSYRKSITVIFRYRYRQKQENDDFENTINHLVDYRKQNFRLETSLSLTKAFKLRNRVELVQYNKDKQAAETGHLLYQDIIWSPDKGKFSGNARFAIFDVSSFDAAVYAYENDVLYSYSVPSYQNSGTRFYLNGRYKIRRGLDFSARYAVSRYRNQETIGSGNDLINGNLKSDIKIQLRAQF